MPSSMGSFAQVLLESGEPSIPRRGVRCQPPLQLAQRLGVQLVHAGPTHAPDGDQSRLLEASYEPLSSGTGFTTEARWNVTGSVGHWGHIHQRINQYRAEVTVESIDNAWRITGLEVLEEERMDPNAPPVR